jgi:5-methylcytosine-specific restriction protein A
MQLRMQPLCEMCLVEGIAEPAVLSDHAIPHRNDAKLFWFGQLRSLCQHHHWSLKQKLENGSRIIRIGLDGYPIDETEELQSKWMQGQGP